MLTQFSVKAFKSLLDVTVKLGSVNVFVGANGSGKSNLLEAIGILGAAASGRVNDESLMHRGVRPGAPGLYRSSFRDTRGSLHISISAECELASYSVTLGNPISKPTPDWTYVREELRRGDVRVVDRSTGTSSVYNPSAGRAALEAVSLLESDPAGQLLELLRNYCIYSPDTPTLRGLRPDLQTREPVGLAGGRLPEGLQELLHSRSNQTMLLQVLQQVDWLVAYAVEASNSSALPMSLSVPRQKMGLRFVDKYMSANRNSLSGYDASEGVLYLLFFVVLALHSASPPLIAIDNFDQALNPRLARDFTRVFCEWVVERGERQILLTTHNPLVLDGLPLQDPRVRLFAVDRSRKGATIVNRVEVTDAIMSRAEKGMTLSQQWVMGHFGGVPASA